MFGKWFVSQITMNKSNGVACEMAYYDDAQTATNAFYSKISSLGSNPATKIVRVMLYNDEGMQINEVLRDNRAFIEPTVVAEPQPQTEEVTE